MAPFVLILIGLAGLIFASEVAVAGARSLATRMGRSQAVVGATVAAIGTSLPEIATNLAVALESGPSDGSGLAVGNIVGSCLSQATLLLGTTAIIAPLQLDLRALRREGGMAVAALMLMALTAADGLTARWEGLTLMACYAAYLVHAWRTGEASEDKPAPDTEHRDNPVISLVRAVAGVSLLVLSANLVVDNGIRLAGAFGITESKLGLVLGLTTGLPELAFAVRGALSGVPALALGNLIGSNITDPLLSFGLGAAVRPVVVDSQVLRVDIPAWGAATVLGLWLLSRPGGLRRRGGIILVAFFIIYAVARGIL